jgi:outer membrane receptor protein involved in Fe transport
MKDIIAQLSTRNIVELCANSGQFCSQITRGAGNVITEVRTGQLNQATSTTRGLDFEASYGFAPSNIWSRLPGQITLHGNASRYLQAYQDSGVGSWQNNVGVIGQVPKWSGNVSVSYRVNEAWTASMTARGFTKYKLASGAIECLTSCPASTANYPTYDEAHTPSRIYLDGSLTYTFRNEGTQRWQAYVNVKNILDKDPPPMPINTYWTANTNTGVYDYLGRVYRAGLRMRF